MSQMTQLVPIRSVYAYKPYHRVAPTESKLILFFPKKEQETLSKAFVAAIERATDKINNLFERSVYL